MSPSGPGSRSVGVRRGILVGDRGVETRSLDVSRSAPLSAGAQGAVSARVTRPNTNLPARRVILVDLPWTRAKDPRVPLGHASILATTRAAGLDVRSVVVPLTDPAFSVDRVVARVLAATWQARDEELLVGVGAYVWNELHLGELLTRIRAALPGARIVVGGPQVSFADAPAQELYPVADAVVRGAGERAVCELARCAAGHSIPGVAWAGQADPGSQALVDLASLPSPFLDGTIPLCRGGFTRWETRRGCAFACSFCQHRTPDRRSIQQVPEARLAAEIDAFARAGIADIAVLDPVFTDGARSARILDRCRRAGLTARLSVQGRPEVLDEGFFDAANGLGLRLEFGLQTIHRAEGRAVRRVNNMARVTEGLGLARRSGVPFEVSLIYGLPRQTLASFHETVAYCLEQQVPVIKAFPLVLLRGTRLDRERETWGLVENDSIIPEVVESHTFGVEDHRQMKALAGALAQTEGAHPPLAELLRMADAIRREAGESNTRRSA